MSFYNSRMLYTLINKVFGHVPETEKNGFRVELINLNFDRSKNTNIVLLLISLSLLFIDILNKQKGLWMLGSKYLFYVHILMVFIPSIILLYLRLNGGIYSNNIKAKRIFVLLFAYFISLTSTLISIIDQLIHGEITVYILGAFLIAVMNSLKPFTSLVLYLINYSLFVIGVSLVQENQAILRGHYVNGAILAVTAWFLSNILYNNKMKDFRSRKTIEHQKAELEKANQQLTITNQKLQESLSALDESQNIIFTLALALESKDPYTRGHSERVTEYALELARYLSLSEADQVMIYHASILHDIGKIGIPDAILNSPSTLTNEEWAIMKSHPERGEAICSKLNFAREVLPIIRHHHEQYDGKGYPDGLSGEDIPFLARLVSIADTVDAMTSGRPYRSAGTFEQALEELRNCAGTQFDPVLVEAFISLSEAKKQLNDQVS